MNEIEKAENIFGFIRLNSQNESHKYDVTEKDFAIEEINSRKGTQLPWKINHLI